jgi:hypothetical protein
MFGLVHIDQAKNEEKDNQCKTKIPPGTYIKAQQKAKHQANNCADYKTVSHFTSLKINCKGIQYSDLQTDVSFLSPNLKQT